jgi:DNA-directed RNA polymerase II subunit RPB1
MSSNSNAIGLARFNYSVAQVRKVKQLQFAVLSPEEVKSLSVKEITTYHTYNNGKPVLGGLNDPALGVIDRSATCTTCKNTYDARDGGYNDCPGHFGHLQLEVPVFHIGFLGEIYKLIQCVCINCSRLLVDKNDPDFARAARIKNGKRRMAAMLKLCKSKSRCLGASIPKHAEKSQDEADGSAGADVSMDSARAQRDAFLSGTDSGCGAIQPKYKRDGLTISIEFREDGGAEEDLAGLQDRKQLLTPAKAYEVLRNISDEHTRLLGFDPRHCRPEWLVLTVLPIAPPHVRPNVALDALTRGEDDITHKYADIIKANAELHKARRSGRTQLEIDQYEALLQYHVATLVDNQLPGQPVAQQRSGKSLKTFRERLVGKGGRLRGNLMGKRVDFSARTVITADPNLSIHQVGVPRSIAMNMTVPETVNRWNLQTLQQLVLRGPSEHPGAKFIIRDDKVRIDLRHCKPSERGLKYGWVVERMLVDDDTVLFNRQPSLHKMSIMCHRVKVLEYSTFRLNLTCTTPYNADFDGDEMNMHALQTLPAIAEAQELMAVPRLIVTPASNRPVMGIVQDTLLGARKMTQRDNFIEKDVFFTMLMWIKGWNGKVPPPAIMRPVPGKPGQFHGLWTGKQAISAFCPEVNYTHGNVADFKDAWPSDNCVIVVKGEYLTGIMAKDQLGNKMQGLLHIIMNDVSPEVCRDFINNCQKVINYWLLHRGFSIGIGDSEADAKTMANIAKIIDEAKKQVQAIVQGAQSRSAAEQLKRQPGQSLMQSFESVVNILLKQAIDKSSQAVQKVLTEATNAVLGMVNAGSKGSSVNISQIIACVGQQNVEGKRISYGFRERTLPHFTKFDLGPESRGFVENSYLKGLTPTEFFMHMMGGREGLIDTAVKTAETGYIQRRLVKCMEDVMVRYDGTVRNANSEVLQFLYGEDGMDGRWIERQSFPAYKLNMRDLRNEYQWDPDAPNFGRAGNRREYFLDPEVAEDMRSNVDTRQALAREFSLIEDDRVTHYKANAWSKRTKDGHEGYLPVPVQRLLENTKRNFAIQSDGVSDLHPVHDVIEPVAALLRRMTVMPNPTNDKLAAEAQENATSLMKILLRSHLASKPLIAKHRMSKAAFRELLGEIESRWFQSIVAPGEMCGVVAAQSIGEPATQMTLNTFHTAGVGSKATQGVPRLKELINVAKRVKTPSIKIFMRDEELRRNREKMYVTLQGALEYSVLGDLLEETTILYDPDPMSTIVEEDQELVMLHSAVPIAGLDWNALSPWVLRLKLSRNAFISRNFRMRDIKEKILEVDPSLHIMDSDDNADIPVIRIRLNNMGSVGGGGGAENVGGGGGDAEDGGNARGGADEGGGGGGGDEDTRVLRDFEANLQGLRLRGVTHVRKLFTSSSKDPVWTQNEGLHLPPKGKDEEYFVETEGTNLLAVLNNEHVDHTRTFSNDIVEIFEVLGIEACRQALLNEIRGLLSTDGAYIGVRHVALLVDSMTFRGFLTAVTRHGINRVDNGPLLRSSFEETCEILMDSAMFGEVDEMNGISGPIMLGQLGPFGTGCFDLLLDDEKLKDALRVAEDEGLFAPNREAVDAFGVRAAGPTPLMQATPGLMGTADMGSVYSPNAGLQFSPAGEYSPAAGLGGHGASTPFSPGGALGGASPGAYLHMMYSPGMAQSPGYAAASAAAAGGKSPAFANFTPHFTPDGVVAGMFSGTPMTAAGGGATPLGGASVRSPFSSSFSPSEHQVGKSPSYSPSQAQGYTPQGGFTGKASPAYQYTPIMSERGGSSSKQYSPTSPGFSAAPTPQSPAFAANATSAYSPTQGLSASPAYSPLSNPGTRASPAYSPTQASVARSPAYSPTSASSAGASFKK